VTPKPAQGANADTASRILDVAERLVQTRGFNGFSYADVARELAITKAGLHYHFPGKAELGEALVARYAARFTDALEAIDGEGGEALAKLRAYAGIYGDVLREGRMCLCGMLAAEYPTLPAPMQHAVIQFFDQSEAWLQRVLDRGQHEGTLAFSGSARDTARMIISSLEGAMLIARPYGDIARFRAAADNLISGLTRPAALDGPVTPDGLVTPSPAAVQPG
jgi:TetR/AcrR family transcriptional repressor of nem operon